MYKFWRAVATILEYAKQQGLQIYIWNQVSDAKEKGNYLEVIDYQHFFVNGPNGKPIHLLYNHDRACYEELVERSDDVDNSSQIREN